MQTIKPASRSFIFLFVPALRPFHQLVIFLRDVVKVWIELLITVWMYIIRWSKKPNTIVTLTKDHAVLPALTRRNVSRSMFISVQAKTFLVEPPLTQPFFFRSFKYFGESE